MPQFFPQMGQQQYGQQPMGMPGQMPMNMQQPQQNQQQQQQQQQQSNNNNNMQQRQNMPSADDQNDPLFMLKEM